MKFTAPIFRGGPQYGGDRKARYYDSEQLDLIVRNFDPALHEVPLQIGHVEGDGNPALGWVTNLWRDGLTLMAEITYTPLLKKIVDMKLFKKVSASFYPEGSPWNPASSGKYLRHVGLVDIPAVKGLPNLQQSIKNSYAISYSEGSEGVENFVIDIESPEPQPLTLPPGWGV